MKLVIINYGLGNLFSVLGAIRKLGYDAKITNNSEEIENADKIILPGVGAFKDGMQNLEFLNLVEPLNYFVNIKKKPIFAICLGFQLLSNQSNEFGYCKGLGWIDANVEKFNLKDQNLRIPHVGWNDLLKKQDSAIWNGVPDDALFYYVHSYHMICKNNKIVIGKCKYGIEFVSAIQKENIYATQFHPEKSQRYGLRILQNFIENT